MLDVQFGQASDFGKVRTNNEDATGAFIPPLPPAGPVSRLPLRRCRRRGRDGPRRGRSATAVRLTEEFAHAQSGTILQGLFSRLIQHANTAVHDRRLEHQYRSKNMATTLVACALRYDQAVVSHVGDSRCYLVRNGEARQITQDHTLVNQQRKLGLISAGDISPRIPATFSSARRAGDVCLAEPMHSACSRRRLVLCTDGMHDETSEAEIASHCCAKERCSTKSPASWSPARSKSTAATTPPRR